MKRLGDKGITLIALVITIIVLLILAGVSVATLTGNNGILTQANNSKTKTKIGEEKERIELAYNTLQIKKNLDEIDEITAENLKTQLVEDGQNQENIEYDLGAKEDSIYFKDSENEYTITEEGKIFNVKENLKVYAYKWYDSESNTYTVIPVLTIPSTNFSEIKLTYESFGKIRDIQLPTTVYKVLYLDFISETIKLYPEDFGTTYLTNWSITGVPNTDTIPGGGLKFKYALKSQITGEYIESDYLFINSVHDLKDWGDL